MYFFYLKITSVLMDLKTSTPGRLLKPLDLGEYKTKLYAKVYTYKTKSQVISVLLYISIL